MTTFLVIVFIVFILFMILGATTKVTPPLKVNNSVTRKEIDVNFSEYPNEYLFSVKGVHLEDYMYPVLNICKELDLINLIPEPDNSFDSDAIKVEDSGWHIGYVPAGETDEVHEIIKKEHIAYIENRNIGGYITITIKIRYKN